MVCTICKDMLEKHINYRWKGTYDLAFDHHRTHQSLKDSAKENCCICRVLLSMFKSRDDADHESHTSIAGKKKEAFFTQASLTYNRQWEAYRLDFRLNQQYNLERVGSFLLKQLPAQDLARPIPNNTSSYGNVQLARKWLNECINTHRMCRHVSPATTWYPTRLVDMGHISLGRVKVVEPRQHDQQITGKYVTLSHCWGDIDFYHLTKDTLARFEDGIALDELPKTFQHAMDFACRLGVRYIWIDSLCILQDSQKDWLYQSAQMDQVYNNSLCNISATAASNSSKGLYVDRDSKQHWIDEVALNTDGIPGRPPDREPSKKVSLQNIVQQLQNANLTNGHHVKQARQVNGNAKKAADAAKAKPKYTILNLGFWEATVDQAPVNRRGWVLQERLIAPRVLHFCHDQIAWECWEKDAVESLADGMPLLQLKAGSIVSGSRLKGMVPSVDGKALRHARLVRGRLTSGKYTDIDAHMGLSVPSIYCFEVWKRVVETYSKTRLTKATDKLIALAGIAKIMSRRILNGRDEDYVAGMWRDNLESQLLWRVDPAVRKDGTYDFHSERPGMDEYRAPSFSWAAIDSERGINYADVTDFGREAETDLCIKIETVILKYKTDDRFGMLTTGGFLELKGVLKRINIIDSTMTTSPRRGYTRYHWQLVKNGRVVDEPYKMIYLDAPSSDRRHIIGPNRGIYCLPVCFERAAEPKELICLLLQAVGGMPNTFKRVGLTKISRYHKEDQEEIMKLSGDENSMDCIWDAQAGRHTIRII
ncbi:HET-domain-containing protein [Mollisia scopiformis]|uniref:HET-domain-containing protein n=1 Tax=Mollisia scopiformis TaxID=149040 RepID=A0A132BAD9_MOLSC|nr:HET-domain-containing protein [Mollisia scopiformis]KUJ09351.1 HET-domain-containing protein [Mollisia scopiformis]